MVLENFSKCSVDRWLCVAAVLSSSWCCSFGSLDENISMEVSLSSLLKQQSYDQSIKQPIKRYIVEAGNGVGGNSTKKGDMAIGEEACAIYALLTAIHMALNPDELYGLAVDDREVADVYRQYADIREKYLPVMECIVSPSFEINGDFLREREKVYSEICGTPRHASIEDFAKIADGNLNEKFQEDIKEKGLVERLRELAMLYYDKECPEGTPLENLPGFESDFRELRWELFEDFIGTAVLIGRNFLDLTDLDAIDDDEQRLSSIVSKWDDYYREETCDVQKQGELFREEIKKLRRCESCVHTAGYFLIGMLKIRPCGDCMLYEKFTLNHFTADEEGSRKIHFDKSFFGSLGNNQGSKKEVNVVTFAVLDKEGEVASWHDEALTPDDRSRWVTYSFKLAKSQSAELAQDMRRWKVLRKKFSRKSKTWGEYVAFKKLRVETSKKYPVVRAVIPIPVPVLIVNKENEDVVSDDRKDFTEADLPRCFIDRRRYSRTTCHEDGDESREWLIRLAISEEYFALLFKKMWPQRRLTCRSKLARGHLHANSNRK
ncbi:MAG: hypothetical protein LW808_003155 [Verrucomicrobiota bacterium]|nr:MAG: hypothetical protein LW808_003155 [Verrucomicrobiota bacterium]